MYIQLQGFRGLGSLAKEKVLLKAQVISRPEISLLVDEIKAGRLGRFPQYQQVPVDD
jgi:hypothetical protein